MKIHVAYMCPHCNKEDHTVMYATDFDTVECHHCKKPIDLKISNINKYDSDVETILPKRECCFCERGFLSNSAYEEEKCPYCGHVDEHFIPHRYK